MWWKFRKKKGVDEAAPTETEDASELRNSGKAPLSKIARKVKNIELVTKKKSSAILSGEYKSRFKGQGMQFSDSRIYQYGDDIRHIDWRTTARMQETYVKTFEEERELNILFVVDASASGDFGSAGNSKKEAVAIALACIGFSAIKNNDRVGLIFFSDRIERYIPSKKGKKHVLRLIDELVTFVPQSKKTNIDVPLNFLSKVLKHGSVVFFASDFFSGFDKKKLEVLARKHDFISIFPMDPRDSELPNVGLLRLEDPETGECVILPTSSASLRKEYQKSQLLFRENLARLLKKSGSSIIELDTTAEAARTLHRFFQSRKGVKN